MGGATGHIDALKDRILGYFNKNLILILVLLTVAIAGYGFELFNLNLTIDEEVHAFSSLAEQWIVEGRWGMYLLNNYLIPQPIIPFVPLSVALIFHILAILLLMSSWGVDSDLEKVMIGAIGVAYPGIAYMYTFSTINFGIGVGLFGVALSLFLYVRMQGRYRLFSVLPAAFAISLYQGFAVALAVSFLILFISDEIRSGRRDLNVKNLLMMIVVGISSAAIYWLVQHIFMSAHSIKIGYVDSFFDIAYFRGNYAAVTREVFGTMQRILSGSPSIYGNSISALAPVVVIMLISLSVRLSCCKLSVVSKLLVALLIVLALMLPFVVGFLMKGVITMRFLVALPILFSGLIMLGLKSQSRGIKLLTSTIVAFCTFQFVISTNTLFSASALALETDRLLAGRVLERIEGGASGKEQQLRYLEVVGFINRKSTRLIPKMETFGASFFEWDQGNTRRMLLFLRTLGYENLQACPLNGRQELMKVTGEMPIWPSKGSVQIIGDTAVIKFGEYSYMQKLIICQSVEKNKYCN